ncbi:hypothetical protein Tco_0273576 [Tanacetum coccineum]
MEITVVTLVEEQMSPWKVEGTSLDPPWSDLELHLSGDEFLRVSHESYGGVLARGKYGEVRVMTNTVLGDLVGQVRCKCGDWKC